MLGLRQRLSVWLGFGLGFLLVGLLVRPSQRSASPHREWQDDPQFPGSPVEVGSPATPVGSEERLAETALRYHLDPALVLAVITVESGNDPAAISEKGAIGLMQILPDTAASMGVPAPADAAGNLEVGCRYLAMLLESFGGDVELALAAYNAGPGAVRHWGTVPPYRETREFVRRVELAYNRLTGGDLQFATRFVSDASTLF